MRILIFTALLLFTQSILAQAPRPMSIQQCVDYAVKAHPSIKNLQFEEALQELKNKEIATITRPQVNFSGSLSTMIIVPQSRSDASVFGGAFTNLPFLIDSIKLAEIAKLPPQRYSTFKFALPWNVACTLQATQILFDPSIFAALEARRSILDLMKINTQLGEEGVRYNVSKAYYNAIIADKKSRSLTENIKLIDDFYKLTDKLVKEGFAERIDAERLLVQKNNLEAEQVKIKNLIQVSYQLLKFQMGMPLDEEIVLTDTINIAAIDNAALNEELDYNKRTEMSQLYLAKKLQELDNKRIEKSKYPTLVAFGNAGLSSSTKSIGDLFTYRYFPSSIIGISLQVPIYDGGARKIKMKQGALKTRQIENNIQLVKNGIALETYNSKTQLRNQIIAYQNQAKNVALAQKILTVVQKKYKEGVGSSIEVIQAQTALKDAQNNYDAALYEMAATYIDYQKALGKLK